MRRSARPHTDTLSRESPSCKATPYSAANPLALDTPVSSSPSVVGTPLPLTRKRPPFITARDAEWKLKRTDAWMQKYACWVPQETEESDLLPGCSGVGDGI